MNRPPAPSTLAACWPAICLLTLSSCAVPGVLTRREPPCPPAAAPAGELSVAAWNIGFAGLGAEAEFWPDGGKKILPSNRPQVKRNLASIASLLRSTDAEFLLIQEAARRSVITRGVDVLSGLSESLPCSWSSFSAKVSLRFFGTLAEVGQATFSRVPPAEVTRLDLPGGPGSTAGSADHLLVTRVRLPGRAGQLVLVNVHLSAFDRGAQVRFRQLRRLSEYVQGEYAAGNYVVCGGDWNLVLSDRAWPYTTARRYLSWVHDLPPWFPPPGWSLAVDRSVPTVRSLERPYRQGQSYTAVIDGFALSPNLSALSVRTLDTQFRWSDHQPVVLRAALR